MSRLFTESQLIDVWREQGFEDADGKWQDVEVVEESNWDDQGKYSSCGVVFTYKSKFYQFEITRSGSYFSYYEYEVYDDATEVELQEYEKTITVRRWVAV